VGAAASVLSLLPLWVGRGSCNVAPVQPRQSDTTASDASHIFCCGCLYAPRNQRPATSRIEANHQQQALPCLHTSNTPLTRTIQPLHTTCILLLHVPHTPPDVAVTTPPVLLLPAVPPQCQEKQPSAAAAAATQAQNQDPAQHQQQHRCIVKASPKTGPPQLTIQSLFTKPFLKLPAPTNTHSH
jgi:hypothetical protein